MPCMDDKGVSTIPGTGINDHVWEADHKHPTPEQLLAMGQRRRSAEEKLQQHLTAARDRKAGQPQVQPHH